MDQARVTPIVYDNSASDSSAKRRYHELVAKWHDIAALPDDAVAERIRVDQLDVLIDLSGHTSGNRLAVLAQKPAPLQVTLFAYPNTTGLSAVDWRITDSVADPPGAEPLYVEKLLRLPSVAWVYGAPKNSPEPGGMPCLAGEPFTFGSLNNRPRSARRRWKAGAKFCGSVLGRGCCRWLAPTRRTRGCC